MLRVIPLLWARLRRLAGLRIRLPLPTTSQVMACCSILGLVGLSFMLGAAVIYFRLPSADFFDKAFSGAKAWHERGRSDDPDPTFASGMMSEGVRLDSPDRTYDGFTLCTTTAGSRARLIDMRGNVVHQWELPFRQAWARAPHVRDPLAEEQIHWFRCYLYPNGDLLAVYHATGDTPYGYGLVKLNKDSKLLWAYAANVHHDVDVGEDGTVYTLAQKLISEPPPGLDFLPSPLIADSLVTLSPEGQELETIPLLEAFRDSPYAPLMFDPPQGRGGYLPPNANMDSKGDFVHANAVKVLSQVLAPKFPLFKPGQVLISLRSLHTLAVLDTHTRSVVWAARGIWQVQHDPEFLENGHLLVYDNCGSNNGSRIIEYDPITQAVPWVYANENSSTYRAGSRGMKQRLPNGNTLITDPDHWMLLEVTQGKELVWEECCGGIVTGARRYGRDELTFLKGDVRARP
jgi:hypothetical protein